MFGLIDKRRRDVAENNGAVVLRSLAGCYAGIISARWSELINPNVGGTGSEPEIESLNGNDIDGANRSIAIRISRREGAAGEECNIQKVPLHTEDVDGIDARSGREKVGFAWGHGVIPAGGQRSEYIVTGTI